jgi:hypothetical protein
MKLSVKERIQLEILYPKAEDIKTMILVKDIQDKITLTQKELAEYKFESTPTGYKWQDEKEEKEVEFTTLELELLKKGVTELDKNKKVTIELIGLVLKIQKA